MTQNNLLSLDEAAKSISISRKRLSAYVEVLGVQRHKGDDRRSYLSANDVHAIHEYHNLEEKSNPAYFGMISYSSDPQPITSPRNYKTFSKEAYGGNDTIYKVLQYITSNASAIPPTLYTDRTMKKPIENHSLLDKLDMPNEEDSGVDFREAALGYLLIDGNSYQYSIRKGIKGPPDELWTLQPNRVTPVAGRTRGITGYRFEDFPNEMNPILPQNIGRMKFWNPDNPVFGMSPLQVGAIMVDMQTAARRWNLSMMQNGAKLSGAWTTDAILSSNDRVKLESRLNEKFSGPKGTGKAPLLDGGFKWNQMGANPSELDWLEGLKYNAGALANLYNIAPQLIGDTSASTYSNMAEARAASYTEAIFPLLDRLYSLWNRWLVPMYPDLKGAYLYYDKSTVEAVKQVIQAQKTAQIAAAVNAYLNGACTLNQALAMQGLPEDPQGNVYRIGLILVPADELMDYARQSIAKPVTPPVTVAEPIQNDPTVSVSPDNEDEKPKPGKKPVDANTDDSNSSGGKPASEPPVEPASKPKSRAFRNTKALDLTSDKDKDASSKQMEDARERWSDDATERIAIAGDTVENLGSDESVLADEEKRRRRYEAKAEYKAFVEAVLA